MVEYADDWSLDMLEIGPGQYKLSLREPGGGNSKQRVIHKHLSLSDVIKLQDCGSKALRYIAGTFR